MAEALRAPALASDGYNVTTGGQFLRWWKTHLWECVPAGLRAIARKNARPMMISLSDDAVWPERGDLAKPQRISRTNYLSGDSARLRPAALVIGESNGLRRKVELPLAVEERLGQVLAYELDRLTPLRADELYFDYRLLSRHATRGTCIVELIAAPKARVNEMMASAKTSGAEVTRLLLSADDVDQGVDLLRAQKTAQATTGVTRWLTPMLLALCGLLAVALVAYPLFKKRQYVIALQPIEASAHAEAEAASIVQRQLEKQVTEYNHLLRRKHASPIAVQVLEDMTKRLPEDTWAQTFEIKPVASPPPGSNHPREVVIQGETGSGAKLLQLVQESTLLKDVALKGSMTRVAPTAERFHFGGELISVEAPPGLSLADANTLMSVPMQVTPNSPAGAPASTALPKQGAAAAPAASSVSEAPKDVAKSSEPPKAPFLSSEQPQGGAPKSTGAPPDIAKKSTGALNPAAPPINQPPASSPAPSLVSPPTSSPPGLPTVPAPERKP
jgi:general secretion pathway protein L